MAITDADQLVEIQWRLVEDVNLSSELWTLAEIAGLFNQRQDQFNRDTGLLLAHEPIVATAGVVNYTLTDEWIATQRVSWRTPTGSFSSLTPADRFAIDTLVSVNQPPSRPIAYDDQSAGIGVIEIGPAPLTNGTLNILYVGTLALLNFNSIAPDIFDIPDDFIPYITYGVLADLLSKEGRGRDLPRAAYCEGRYQEGVAIASLFLGGFS